MLFYAEMVQIKCELLDFRAFLPINSQTAVDCMKLRSARFLHLLTSDKTSADKNGTFMRVKISAS
jgi:hypothetical protein